MKHFHKNVPGLGNVAISRHAQARAEEQGITDQMVEDALFRPSILDTPEGDKIVTRQRGNVRLVILLFPEPNRGARLVKTIYKVQPQGKAK